MRRKREAPIWTQPAPGSRKPRFTREQIAEAALAIADHEGFDAVSMRRIADDLGAATMTLYHYVRTKEDLLALMDDTIMAEVLVSDAELAQGWKKAIAAIARKSRDAFRRHPWSLYALRGARFGPNGMRHVEQSLAAVADAPLDEDDKARLLGIVDDFVFGHVMRTQQIWGPSQQADVTINKEVAHFLGELLDSGEFPHLSRVIGVNPSLEGGSRMGRVMTEERTFELGLDAILAIGDRASASAQSATHPPAVSDVDTLPESHARGARPSRAPRTPRAGGVRKK